MKQRANHSRNTLTALSVFLLGLALVAGSALGQGGAPPPAPGGPPGGTGNPWQPGQDGSVPEGFLEAGSSPDGAIALCLVDWGTSSDPGKISAPSGEGCWTIKSGAVELRTDYQVFVGDDNTFGWAPWQGDLPAKAVETGAFGNSNPKYACRVNHVGQVWIPGKFRANKGDCQYVLGPNGANPDGTITTSTQFEVLVSH
ncbi:MAG: DUF3421 domain-containing protein [bacterium]|nr:DUF3421 domain-containing protein [bacterium]